MPQDNKLAQYLYENYYKDSGYTLEDIQKKIESDNDAYVNGLKALQRDKRPNMDFETFKNQYEQKFPNFGPQKKNPDQSSDGSKDYSSATKPQQPTEPEYTTRGSNEPTEPDRDEPTEPREQSEFWKFMSDPLAPVKNMDPQEASDPDDQTPDTPAQESPENVGVNTIGFQATDQTHAHAKVVDDTRYQEIRSTGRGNKASLPSRIKSLEDKLEKNIVREQTMAPGSVAPSWTNRPLREDEKIEIRNEIKQLKEEQKALSGEGITVYDRSTSSPKPLRTHRIY